MTSELENYVFQNIQFIINNNGFPLDEASFGRMIEFSKYLNKESKEKINQLLNPTNVKQRKIPELPKIHSNSIKPLLKVELIQNYMNKLEYNYTGTQFFCIKSNRSLNGLMEDAKEMVRDSLPIKCLEAVVLGIFLTNGVHLLERFTIGFRSSFNGNLYNHVVLGVYYNGLYGAIGMSRRAELMYKPLTYTSLTDVINSFVESYHFIGHNLRRITIGEIISHDPCSLEPIHWKGLVLYPRKLKVSEFKELIEHYSKKLRKQAHFRSQVNPYSNGSTLLPRPSKYHSRNITPKKESTIIYFNRSKSSLSNHARSHSIGSIRV